MMVLPDERIGPYVRALARAVTTAAPHGDFCPLAEVRAHLAALDPTISGPTLLPAEVDARSGMPSFVWMERVVAESTLAAEGELPSEESIDRARSLDPELAARLRGRRGLRQHLLRHPPLPTLRLAVHVRRLKPELHLGLVYDRLEPQGTMVRIRVELAARAADVRALKVDEHGRAWAAPGVSALLTRHTAVPLLLLQRQVEKACAGRVTRLSRSRIGPFWFPGVRLPEGIPQVLGSGLLLHLSTELVSDDMEGLVHRDPCEPALQGEPPAGQGLFSERRFACSSPLAAHVERWASSRMGRPSIATF